MSKLLAKIITKLKLEKKILKELGYTVAVERKEIANWQSQEPQSRITSKTIIARKAA